MGIFDKKEEEQRVIKTNTDTKQSSIISTRYGREITTAQNSKKELYFKPQRVNPQTYINQQGTDLYYGMQHLKDEFVPVYLPQDEVTMQLLIGSTRNG